MKVSIVTCTYNSHLYLRECLKSIALQTYHDIEHLVIDGYSTDGTLDILDEYPTVKVYSRKPKGISDAMNYGIQKSTGTIIAHLHSDDYYYDSSSVEHMVTAVMGQNTEWGFGKLQFVYPGGRVRFARSGQYSLEGILWKNIIYHPTVFIKRDVFLDVGLFDTNLKYAMDIDLWLRIAKKYEPTFVDKTISCFRVHSSSLSIGQHYQTMCEGAIVRMRHAGMNPRLIALIFVQYIKRLFQKLYGIGPESR